MQKPVYLSPMPAASSGVSKLIVVSSEPAKVDSGVTTSTRTYQMDITFEEEKPVQIVEDAIEINEELLKENTIVPVNYRGEQFYVRKIKGAPEIFQIAD